MTDTTNNAPVRVTAEERPHPALRKLARAVIALARLGREDERGNQVQQAGDEASAPSAGTNPEVCHG